MKPIYMHDCERCFHLGSIFDPESNRCVDLYSCETIIGTSIISRYSDDAPEYQSFPLSVWRKIRNDGASKGDGPKRLMREWHPAIDVAMMLHDAREGSKVFADLNDL